MYRDHPQSPIPADTRAGFAGCRFHEYDPSWRTTALIENADPDRQQIPVSTGGSFSFTRIGVARFALQGVEHELELTWNDGYGGGIFLAFTDETSGTTTYGGGRYLIDTVKGADLGFDRENHTAVLDFNFAFNPSCSYDPRWACPLAPPANRLPIPVKAGEQPRRTDPPTGRPGRASADTGERPEDRPPRCGRAETATCGSDRRPHHDHRGHGQPGRRRHAASQRPEPPSHRGATGPHRHGHPHRDGHG